MRILMGPGQAVGRDQSKARVSLPGRTGMNASGNNRCTEVPDLREHHRAGREGRDDRRGVQRHFQNLRREHARADRTTGHGSGRESYNHCHRRRREPTQERRVRSTLTQLPL